MPDRPFDRPAAWPGADEPTTVRLSQEEIDDAAKEGHIAFLFSKIPIGYQERFRPYLFGSVLNSNQREVLATDAVDAKNSEELKGVEARAKDWLTKATAAQRALGEAASRTLAASAPDTQAFLDSVLSEEALVTSGTDIQPSNDTGRTRQKPSEEEAGQPAILPREEPQSSTNETNEVHTERLLFANFKKALWAEIDRYRTLMDEGDNELHYRWDSHRQVDFAPAETIIRNELTRHFNEAYLDNNAVPDQLAPHIYRTLRPNERHAINYPRGFSPNKLLNALENRKFESLQTSARPMTFSNEPVQIPAAAITSVKFSTLQEGRVVELPEAAQPHNPTQLFEQCFNEPLPAEAFLFLAGREKYASNYNVQFHVDELRIGALADGSAGLELVMRQPSEKRMLDVTILAAALIGERKLATVLADTVAIY